MSESPNTCPECGATLPPGTDLGACPRCLLAAGLGDSEPPAGAAASGAPVSSAPTPAEVAAFFPHLEILELIGQGGMGVVYKARQISLDRVVALKILPSSISDDPAFSSRFTREAKTMARLDHPNIVRVHEFGETEGRYYLVMEYIEGSNLREVMAAAEMAPREALAIVPQICEALQYAHDRGVVHRDIKPENVLIDRAGKVKITDFGLAKLQHHEPHEMTLTGVGQVMGTPQYMAPEQYRTPQDVDHRADIYSLGVVFYEMLTGDVPMGRFDPPSEKVEVDVRLDDVVLRTLEKERERRYQRVDAVGTEVTSIVGTPPPLAEAKSPPPRKRAFEPEAPVGEPRMSRLALAGFLCLPAVLLVPVLAIAVGGLLGAGEMVIPISMGLAFLTLAGGFFLSLAGWITTARSRGALKGQGLAIAGTIVPIPLFLLLMAAFGMLYFLLLTEVEEPEFAGPEELWESVPDPDWPEWESVRPPQPEVLRPSAPPIPLPPEPRRPTLAAAGRGPTVIGAPAGGQAGIAHSLIWIETLWAGLQDLGRGAKVTPAQGASLVAVVDIERYRHARAEDRAPLQEQGFLGLPFPPSSIDASSFPSYRLDTVDFSPIAKGEPFATVTVRSGDDTLTFDIIGNGDEWHYAIAPLRRSSDTSWDKPELVRDAPADWSRNQRRNLQTQVQLLWSIYGGLWEGSGERLERVPPDLVRSVLAPAPAGAAEAESVAALAREGREGARGLLFLDATTLPAPLADYRLKSITPLRDGASAVVVAEAASSSLTFRVVLHEGRWWLGRGLLKVAR